MHSYEYSLLCDFDETQEAGGTRLVLFFCYSNHGRLPKHALRQKVKCSACRVEGVLFVCRLHLVNTDI